MKIKLAIFAGILLTFISGCVVRPVHRAHDVKLVLADEHNSKKVVVVNSQPAKARNCWRHKKHWHCNK